MNYQTSIVSATQEAADEFFRYAAAVPADKLEWKPLDAGRSVIDMAREVAKCADWAHQLCADDKPWEWNEEAGAASKAESDQWKTVADCQTACKSKFERLFELFKTIPDEKLKDTKWLPFNGGRDHTWAEMMDYPRWNSTYHTGQVAYVQTLYGDKEMH